MEGQHFNDLHKVFESQFDAFNETIDEVAERIRALGMHSPSSLAEFQAAVRLKEDTDSQILDKKMLSNLLADHEAIIR